MEVVPRGTASEVGFTAPSTRTSSDAGSVVSADTRPTHAPAVLVAGQESFIDDSSEDDYESHIEGECGVELAVLATLDETEESEHAGKHAGESKGREAARGGASFLSHRMSDGSKRTKIGQTALIMVEEEEEKVRAKEQADRAVTPPPNRDKQREEADKLHSARMLQRTRSSQAREIGKHFNVATRVDTGELDKRGHSCLINPQGKFRIGFDLTIIVLLLYISVVTPVRIGFEQDAKGYEEGEIETCGCVCVCVCVCVLVCVLVRANVEQDATKHELNGFQYSIRVRVVAWRVGGFVGGCWCGECCIYNPLHPSSNCICVLQRRQ